MYPIMLDLTHKKVLVVGGGTIASRKIKGLLTSSVEITVISPELKQGISSETVNWLKKYYESGDTSGFDLVFACTTSKEVNDQIVTDCQPTQWVNNVSDKNQSDFYNMATIQTEELLLALSTFGNNPSRSKQLKRQLQEWLEQVD